MVVEPTPVESDGDVLLSRPGLVDQSTDMGSGPIEGLYQKSGSLSGVLYGVSGTSLYKATASHGTVTGTGPVSFAGSETELLVTRGASLHRTDGTTFSTVSFPDAANVTAPTFLAGYFIAVRADSAKFYFSGVLDGTDWDALDFATAENEPDKLLDCLAVDDTLILLGARTIEYWPKTGNADIPFAPTAGSVFEKGVIATGCAAKFDNSFAWIGHNGIVYRASDRPLRISDSGIEERIAVSTTYRAFTFFWEGHELFCIRLDAGTWAYDALTGNWSEFASYGLANWQCGCAVDGPVFGSATDGKILAFGNVHTDLGGQMERRFRGGVPLPQPYSPKNIRFSVNSGQTPNLSGGYTDPVMEVRFSRDHGQTFGNYRSAKLGVQGKYRKRVELRRLGMFDDPSFIFEARCTDPIPFRVSDVQLDAQGGGRSR